MLFLGSQGVIPTTNRDLEAALEMGIDWSLREGYLLNETLKIETNIQIYI